MSVPNEAKRMYEDVFLYGYTHKELESMYSMDALDIVEIANEYKWNM